MKARILAVWPALVSGGVLALFWGCSGTPAPGGSDAQTSDASVEAGESGSGGNHPGFDASVDGSRDGAGAGARSADATPDATLPDVTFSYVPPRSDGALSRDAACASLTTVAESLPLDLYVMLDRSGSMNIPKALPPAAAGDCDVGDGTVSRWCFAINALDGFFGSSESAGTGVALQFFPGGDCSGDACCHEGECCNGADDAIAQVPLAPLPSHMDALTQALNGQEPRGTTTPVEPALRGMLSWTLDQKTPERTVASVLITDGAATGCDTSVANLSEIVRQHHDEHGVRTFLVGMSGADFALLEALAEAGGSPEHDDFCPGGSPTCRSFNVGSGDPMAFRAALQQIRETAVQCTFRMPESDAGIVDPEQISLRFSAGDETERLEQVSEPSGCDEGGGFYYDDAESPTQISLCSTSCERLRASSGAQVEVLLGCLQG